ncbi:hypothetical protein DBB31_11410 [Burkholderia multivorans]|nr:hypothetical protein DBB31_11410 [Burkholderia multivorans]
MGEPLTAREDIALLERRSAAAADVPLDVARQLLARSLQTTSVYVTHEKKRRRAQVAIRCARAAHSIAKARRCKRMTTTPLFHPRDAIETGRDLSERAVVGQVAVARACGDRAFVLKARYRSIARMPAAVARR